MPEIPAEMSRLINRLDLIPDALFDIIEEAVDKRNGIQKPVLNTNYFLDPETLRSGRGELEDFVEEVNTLLFTYFKNDQRLHMPFMKLLSIMTQCMEYLDEIYAGSKLGEGNSGELGDIRSGMKKKQIAETNVQPPGGGPVQRVNTYITPSHYESYIQIYKTPDAAIENYRRYTELQEKRDRTKAEQKEFEKRDRIDTLADRFDQSHRYMLEKNSYSQQDVDYAFSLAKKQLSANVHGEIKKQLSGEICQTLILEKIFGGIKQRFKNHINKVDQAKNPDMVREWLDNDLHECITRKKEDMKTVIRAIKRTEEDADEAAVLSGITNVVDLRWIHKIFFNEDEVDMKVGLAKNNIERGWLTLVEDKTSKTGADIDGLIKSVMQEDNLIRA